MSFFKPNISALKAKRDVAGLLNALKGKDAQIRREAIKALGDLGARPAVPALCDILLARDVSVADQAEVADALGKQSDAASLDALAKASTLSHERERKLIEMATSSPDRRYHEGYYITQIATSEYLFRSRLANAIAQIGDERAVTVLFDLLASESGQMASQVKQAIESAIEVVLQKYPAETPTWLAARLKHPSLDVRHRVAQLLGDFGTANEIDELLDLACDENEHYTVRQAALMSLGRVGDRSVLPVLEDLMGAGNRGLKRDAEQAAAQIREHYPSAPEI